MVAKKNSARKKKRISKHVLMAKETMVEGKDNEPLPEGMEGVMPPPPPPPSPSASSTPKKQKKGKKKAKVKDPTEAASYLSLWKHRDAGGGAWKFNKNTQSWLIRNMYQPELINKGTFSLLMDYLISLPQGITRTRVADDATRRAVRYKQFEKEQQQQEEEEEEEENQPKKGNSDHNDNDGKEKLSQAAAAARISDDLTEDESQRWDKLSHHDKRKEYKRARKVLEVLKAEGE